MISHLAQVAHEAGAWLGGATIWLGMWIVAQSLTVEGVGQTVIGAGVIAAGVAAVRWVIKASDRVEATFVGAIEAATLRAAQCEADCERLRIQADDLRIRYDAERALRISLESPTGPTKETTP